MTMKRVEEHLEKLKEMTKNFDLELDTFERTRKVHDWRNYVPRIIKDAWDMTPWPIRASVALTAEIPAHNEEWD